MDSAPSFASRVDTNVNGSMLYWRIARKMQIDPRVIEREWSMMDVLDAHEMLDIEAEFEYLAMQESKKRS